MVNNNISLTARNITWMIGLLLLGLGLATLIHPQTMQRYGLIADTLHAVMSIRALIGGAEIGLGILMLIGGKLSITLKSRLWVALFLFSGIAMIRLISILLADAAVPEIIYRELVAEVLVICVVLIGIRLS